MGGGIDTAGQAVMIVSPARASPPAEPLGLPQAVLRAVPRAHDAHRQGIARQDSTPYKEHAGWIVNLPKCPRIGGVDLGENIDPMLAHRSISACGVDFVIGRRDVRSSFGPTP